MRILYLKIEYFRRKTNSEKAISKICSSDRRGRALKRGPQWRVPLGQNDPPLCNFVNFKFHKIKDFDHWAHEKKVYFVDLANEYLITKIGVVTVENGPSKVWNRETRVLVAKLDE